MLLISNKPILHTTSLCSHINSIYTKLAQLDRQIQTHCLYPHSQSDLVQLNAPEYDSDIDDQTDILPDIQPQALSHAKNTEEDILPHIDVQQSMTQKEINLLIEIDRPDISCNKRHPIFMQIYMTVCI